MPRYLLAHDLGTSGNKATLYDEAGRLVASRTVSYATRYFNGNWAEQEPADWWHAVCLSTQALLAEVRAAEIAVVALSGQMMGCTVVDRRGALRPSILIATSGPRSRPPRILEQIDLQSFYGIVGHRVSASYSLEKLHVDSRQRAGDLRPHTPHAVREDFINFRLTGRMATDYSDASGTNAFDLNTFQWSERIIGLAGVDGTMFPQPMDSARVLGEITPEAAAATGLKAGTPVAVGGGDGSCAGSAWVASSPARRTTTSARRARIALTVTRPIVDEQMRTMNWRIACPAISILGHDADGRREFSVAEGSDLHQRVRGGGRKGRQSLRGDR